MKNKKDLIAQISRNLGEQPTAVADASAKASPVAAPSPRGHSVAKGKAGASRGVPDVEAEAPRATGSGKQAAFWLDDEDRAIFHETGMLLYSEGIKPSHNLVLRAAIRMLPRDHRLIEKVRELIEKDGRKLRHQKK